MVKKGKAQSYCPFTKANCDEEHCALWIIDGFNIELCSFKLIAFSLDQINQYGAKGGE